MKRVLLIFLLLQFASNNTFAAELFRLPALFSHYQHHSSEHHDIDGFADFLYKHYAKSPHQDNDEEHRDLPFKHHTGDCSAMHNSANGFVPSFQSDLSLYPTQTTLFFSIDEAIQSLELSCIWQPPKLA